MASKPKTSTALTVYSNDPQKWATRVRDAMKLGAVAGLTIAGGQALIDAKADLKHGEWERMFNDHEEAVKDPLPFGNSTGFRLMKIATSKILSNPAHGQVLPPSWRTLYELTLIPEAKLERAFERGLITPDMERADVKLLMPPKQQGPAPDDPMEEGIAIVAAASKKLVEALLALRPHWKKLSDGQVDQLRMIVGQASTKLTELETRHE